VKPENNGGAEAVHKQRNHRTESADYRLRRTTFRSPAASKAIVANHLQTRKSAAQTEEPTLDPARVMGPLPPPPIPVEVETGLTVDVPYFAIHIARFYKTRFGG